MKLNYGVHIWTPRSYRSCLPILMALCALGVLAACSIVGSVVPVQIARRKPITHKVVATGRVMPPERAQLGSTVVGRVAAVHVKEGDRVKAGQLLIQIQDAEAKAAVEQAIAGVAQAEARAGVVRQVNSRLAADSLQQARNNLDQAQRQHHRVESLHASGVAAQMDLDDARLKLENARSQMQSAETLLESSRPSGSDDLVAATALAQAKAALVEAHVRLDQTRIVAPADRLVLTRQVHPGDIVQPGRVLMVLARDSETELSVQPDEKNLAFLRVGQVATASADAFPDDRFEARVIRIAPAIDADRGTVEIKLVVDRPPPYLRADMTISINVEVAYKADALALPSESVRDIGTDHPWVMLAADGRLSKQPVKLGIRGDGVVEVIDGLVPGQAVVPPSAGPLRIGARVRTRPAEARDAL
ncbi:MAG: efflux RND transporter periplasmic adaptor subunit [Bryobacterales bacterium]|nr:efflux RND transporter periplasmic adaptor subunit [Bryobacterales bacterium]